MVPRGPGVRRRLVHRIQKARPLDEIAAVAHEAHSPEIPHVFVYIFLLLDVMTRIPVKAVFVIVLMRCAPAAVALDQLGEIARLLRFADERVLEKLPSGRPLLGVPLQA